MEMEIIVPEEVPMMTLPGIAFFPQALLPLHIFEARYRTMLVDVLATNRLFAVAGIDPNKPDTFEAPHRIATIGIVRACQENKDGTSNLLLQGLARGEVRQIMRNDPYRVVNIHTLASLPGAEEAENLKLRARLSRLLSTRQRLSGESSSELSRFLRSVDDPEIFVDLAAFSFCDNLKLKQRLLETLDVNRRLELFSQSVSSDIDAIKLRKQLQGDLTDDNITNN